LKTPIPPFGRPRARTHAHTLHIGLHWRQETVKGVKGAVQRVLVMGPHEHPSYVIDADTQVVIWDHRIHKEKAAVPIIKSLQPYEGRVWCRCPFSKVLLNPHLKPYQG